VTDISMLEQIKEAQKKKLNQRESRRRKGS